MSGQATGWVLREGPRPTDVDRKGQPYGQRARGFRSVLLTIADAANRDGEHAHPGQQAMVEGSLYGRSHVVAIVGELLAEGWVVVEQEGGGRGKATVYAVQMDRRETGRPLDGSSEANRALESEEPRGGDEETARPDADTARSQAFDLGEPAPNGLSNGTPNGNPNLWETFWTAYPRKVAKPEAERAWRRAITTATPEAIQEGLARWIRSWSANQTEAQYIAHPATWLNQHRWNDDPPPTRVQPGAPPLAGPRAAVTSDRTTEGRVLDL